LLSVNVVIVFFWFFYNVRLRLACSRKGFEILSYRNAHNKDKCLVDFCNAKIISNGVRRILIIKALLNALLLFADVGGWAIF